MGYRYDTYRYIVPYLSFLVHPQGNKELKREVGAFDIHRGVGANLAFVCGVSVVLDPGRVDSDPASVLPHYGSGFCSFFSGFLDGNKKSLRVFGCTHSL
jgi:hypothetical protein